VRKSASGDSGWTLIPNFPLWSDFFLRQARPQRIRYNSINNHVAQISERTCEVPIDTTVNVGVVINDLVFVITCVVTLHDHVILTFASCIYLSHS
jgi:hypothetical protein